MLIGYCSITKRTDMAMRKAYLVGKADNSQIIAEPGLEVGLLLDPIAAHCVYIGCFVPSVLSLKTA